MQNFYAHKSLVTDKQNFSIDEKGTRWGDTPNFVIDAETRENAILICELLVALESTFEMLSGLHKNEENPYINEVINQAKIAIAKARGE